MAQQYLDKTGLSYFWDKIKSKFLRGNVGGVFYGTCSSGASATAKVVECADFTSDNLKAGTIIVVSFSATNSGAVASLTLNVNSTGAKPIKYINNGTLGNLSSAGYLKAGTEYPFYYDGANWVVWMNYNTTYSALSEADMHTGTATTARTITAARLKQAVQYHALVKSVNGSTGDVTVAVPTKTSDLTNDSGFITSAPVTSVNGQTGAVTVDVPTDTSELNNDSGFITTNDLNGYATTIDVEELFDYPEIYATDSASQAVLSQAFGTQADIKVPSDYTQLFNLVFDLNPRKWFAWLNGTELEIARLTANIDVSSNTATLYLRGKSSVASGIMGVDSSWTITPIDATRIVQLIPANETVTINSKNARYTLTMIGGGSDYRGMYIVAGYNSSVEMKAISAVKSGVISSSGTNVVINNNESYAMYIAISIYNGNVTVS